MSFEEFFKKKKIDLDAFQQGNPALLSEFKKHFELMGEKSFDHTKKFWFNKLRLQYQLSPEIKTEKLKMENPLAEQTVADSLAESTLSEPRPAATSKFQESPINERPNTEHTDEKAATVAPKPAFTPRFKPGVTKPVEPTAPKAEENIPADPAVEKPKGFTPRFKAGVTKSVEQTEPTQPSAENKPEEQPAAEKPKGFTPRFKAGVTKPADTETPVKAADEIKTDEPAAEKPKGFTPRFKAGITKPAQPNEQPAKEEVKTDDTEPLRGNTAEAAPPA